MILTAQQAYNILLFKRRGFLKGHKDRKITFELTKRIPYEITFLMNRYHLSYSEACQISQEISRDQKNNC